MAYTSKSESGYNYGPLGRPGLLNFGIIIISCTHADTYPLFCCAWVPPKNHKNPLLYYFDQFGTVAQVDCDCDMAKISALMRVQKCYFVVLGTKIGTPGNSQ